MTVSLMYCGSYATVSGIGNKLRTGVCVRVFACVCACAPVRACAQACVRLCVCLLACVCVCVRACVDSGDA